MVERWNQRLRDHPVWTATVLCLITFAAYAPALGNGFAFDDEQVIIQNPIVADPHAWWQALSTPAWAYMGVATWSRYYRPLQIFSYWLLWRLDGPNPGAYHLFQVLLYVATVWLAYRVARELLDSEVAAFAGATLWALHPLHVEAVAWAASLTDVGAGFFFFLALLIFLLAERERHAWDWRHVAAALAVGLSLLFKEMALTFPLLILAYWFFLGKEGGWPKRLIRLAPYVAAVGVYLVARILVLGHFSAGTNFWHVTPSLMGSALALLGAHLRLFVWPVDLSPLRTFDWSTELLTIWPWAALLLLGVAWVLRRRQPILAFLVFFWAITLLPCLDYRQLCAPYAADRYAYLPTVGLCLAVGWLGTASLAKVAPGRRSFEAATAAVAVVAILWTAGTEAAIPRWRNTQSLIEYSLRKYPDSPLPHIYRATDLQFRRGDLEGAKREFKTVLRLNSESRLQLFPVICQADLGLGRIAYLEGRLDDMFRYFNEVLSLCPDGGDSIAVHDAIGALWFVRGEYSKAAESFRQAVRWGPADVSGHFYLGTCEMKLGHYREAANEFRTVTTIDPTLRPAFMALAQALDRTGDTAGAEQVRRQAARL